MLSNYNNRLKTNYRATMPTKQDIITWALVVLICILFFMIGCIRENNNSNYGNFMLCDTTALHNNSIGE